MTSSIPGMRRSRNVPVELVAHLERLIATGELAPGTKLPAERELALSMSVSRSSLREAMHELESKHLVERTPGRGTIVMRPSDEVTRLRGLAPDRMSADHVAELREVIEPRVAGFAALRATPANVLQLSDVLDRSSEDLRQAESLRLDVEFHLLLAQAAQNPLLSALCTMSSEWTGDVRAHSHATRRGRRISLRGHHAIHEAVAAHDVAGAQAAMAAHLADVRELIARAAHDDDGADGPGTVDAVG
ncbi:MULTISPECIES: FadR/GntR family transcriptional regulator [Clavibacter]|nr:MULTISPECIES: FCD domain-containing protein [Clavibacter]MBF4620807.1 FadR family transcriptional regulator [Clavibacter sp. VKM Ac-2542]MBM7389288.1 GntR family transcriptional repressor for pyruvate dehydrogenase complex [Clavibacter michiganensis]UKF31420.1 FadR family transcriptional regulator [Clavibacter phaseoli]UKF37341.1 FadR family transcriptional regulator [Clavibacter phaseoli]